MQFFSHDLVMVAFPTVQVLLWHAPTLAKTRTAVISMASCCSLTSSLTMLCPNQILKENCHLDPLGSIWHNINMFIPYYHLLPYFNLFHPLFQPHWSQIRCPKCSEHPGGHLLQLPAIRDAAVVKVHPSIGAAALRTALVMAKKSVPWQLGGGTLFSVSTIGFP